MPRRSRLWAKERSTISARSLKAGFLRQVLDLSSPLFDRCHIVSVKGLWHDDIPVTMKIGDLAIGKYGRCDHGLEFLLRLSLYREVPSLIARIVSK
jgi:hypothetical protein